MPVAVPSSVLAAKLPRVTTTFGSTSRSCPEGPTNGRPCLSSWKPGASPTNITSAVGLPWPNTTWVRLSCNRQRVQVAASAASNSSSVLIGGGSLKPQQCPQAPPQQPPPAPVAGAAAPSLPLTGAAIRLSSRRTGPASQLGQAALSARPAGTSASNRCPHPSQEYS